MWQMMREHEMNHTKRTGLINRVPRLFANQLFCMENCLIRDNFRFDGVKYVSSAQKGG